MGADSAQAADGALPDCKARASEIQGAVESYESARAALEERRKLRDVNRNPERQSDAALKKLDSTVKRNSALVKKLRQVGEEGLDALLRDIRATNQSKYVSEVVAAVAEAAPRAKDMGAALQVCSLLHQRYADFGPALGPAIETAFHAAEDGGTRRRSLLRLLAELVAVGVVTDEGPLLRLMKGLLRTSFQRDPGAAQAALALVAGIAKSGREEYLGLPPRNPASLSPGTLPEGTEGAPEEVVEAARKLEAARGAYVDEVAARWVASEAARRELRVGVDAMFDAACTALLSACTALQDMEVENSRIEANRGQLPEDVVAAYDKERRHFEALQRGVSSLAEVLDRQPPALPEGPTRMAAGKQAGVQTLPKDADAFAGGPFEDEQERAFYVSLPDLRALVPAVLLGDAGERKKGGSEKADESAGGSIADAAPASASAPSQVSASERADLEMAVAASRAQLDALEAALPSCSCREAADQLATDFCFANSKGARKRLARALSDVPRNSMHLLPFYARIGATLSQVFPDIGAALVQAVEDEFATLQARKDVTQQGSTARVTNAVYLGELTKFRLAPPATFFATLKVLFEEFVGHNVEAAATLLDTAGHFLFRQKETHTRMALALETINRLKNAKNLDPRLGLLVDGAICTVDPPQRTYLRRKRRQPLQAFICHLLDSTLQPDTVKAVMKKLRRLPWAESEAFLVRRLLAAVKGRYSHASTVASLASGLSRYHPSLGIALTDAVLEEVRIGLEFPDQGNYQKRVAHIRLLGELYNYRLADSRVIFDTLYLVLGFGHETAETAARLDPPTSYFRIRLVGVLLDACGHFFSHGSAARRLDRFLAFFQRYVLAKPQLPLDVQFDVEDLFDKLRPEAERWGTFEEASAAVEQIEREEAEAAAAGVPADDDDDASEMDDESGSELGGRRGGDGAAEASERGDDPGSTTDAGSDDDDDDAVRSGALAPPEVDDEFERELASAMQAAGPSAGPLGASLLQAEREVISSDKVTVTLLMRRGNKTERALMQVPSTNPIAFRLAAEAAREAAERARMKALTLQAAQREPEEPGALARPIKQSAPVEAAPPPPRRGYRARGGGAGGGRR